VYLEGKSGLIKMLYFLFLLYFNKTSKHYLYYPFSVKRSMNEFIFRFLYRPSSCWLKKNSKIQLVFCLKLQSAGAFTKLYRSIHQVHGGIIYYLLKNDGFLYHICINY